MSSALVKFKKSNKDGDIKKAAQKVSDPKKDTVTRLKHLKTVLENYDIVEAKRFFEDAYSHIYYIFFDNFVTVEADLKQRANKSHREELDQILHIYEASAWVQVAWIQVELDRSCLATDEDILELIHKKWMFHSIGRIMKKLFHPSNGLKVRQDGMHLFLTWYQILQDNVSEECHQIFFQLAPGLGDGEKQDVLYGRSASVPDMLLRGMQLVYMFKRLGQTDAVKHGLFKGLMPPGTLFQLIGPWYANARSLYDLVIVVAMVSMFGSDDDLSGLAGVYTFKSSDRYFGYEIVNAVVNAVA